MFCRGLLACCGGGHKRGILIGAGRLTCALGDQPERGIRAVQPIGGLGNGKSGPQPLVGQGTHLFFDPGGAQGRHKQLPETLLVLLILLVLVSQDYLWVCYLNSYATARGNLL